MDKIALYWHSGSKNHGCEAIVRSTQKILNLNTNDILFSRAVPEDKLFQLQQIISLQQVGCFRKHDYFFKLKQYLKPFIPDIILQKRRLHIEKKIDPKRFQSLYDATFKLALSIGGDCYCYDLALELAYINQKLNSLGRKTVLWGCSVEPSFISSRQHLREDLKRYSLITARESLTYNALIQNGINKNTHLFPDPAFVMETVVPADLPDNFLPGNTVGLNLSPLVQRLEKGSNIAFKNFEMLMSYILDNSKMTIALIPHVIWENNNDLGPLRQLYHKFKHTGRVCLIDKPYNAPELKGIISQCRFMVAARTHASIAAYSTQVPTLVIGYSVKARGIARDIFGTDDGYVLPVQNLKKEDEITQAFINLIENEDKIRAHYKTFMPGYVAKAYQAAEEVKKLL